MNGSLVGKLMATRRGTLTVGIAAAGLAGILLLLYLDSYRNSVRVGTATVGVLVAKSLIPKGTSGTQIGEQQLFQVSQRARDEVKVGALVDPAAIAGRTAVADIFPGQQLTAADFSPVPLNTLPSRLTGAQRAVAIPIDSAHGLLGHIRAGDSVDVYVAVPASLSETGKAVLRLLIPKVEVLAAPEGAEGGNVVLNAEGVNAAKLAFAVENATLWFVLRPQSGAAPTKAWSATAENLRAGSQSGG